MNIYWPIYLNIESEINKLMYAIHMDDSHLNVHSSIISDLILRCCAEIESLAKELYKNNGGPKKSGIKYDYDALKFLNDKWILDKKIVVVSSINCFFSKNILTPYNQDTPKTDVPKKLTYLWNNAYQNLKHDRRNGLQYGNVEALFSAAAALYLLNIYFKDLEFHLGDYGFTGNTKDIDFTQGSSIFSITMHHGIQLDSKGSFIKVLDFESAVYTSVVLENTAKEAREALKPVEDFQNKYITDRIVSMGPSYSQLSKDESQKLIMNLYWESFRNLPKNIRDKMYLTRQKIQVKAVLNKNQF